MQKHDYDFVTDRLAIGNVASRATPGFVAVVSILATERPGTMFNEWRDAPELEHGVQVQRRRDPDSDAEWYRAGSWIDVAETEIPVLRIDLADGEGHHLGSPTDRHGRLVPSRGLEDYLDDTTAFIAAHIRHGCVLVHCGAGKSRSVAVVVAYLCRYAGMGLSEALAFVAARRPGACPAPCFVEAIKRWLRLDELATKGPRR